MKTENILAKNIKITNDGAALDASCKRLLANKAILAWILKECVTEYKDYSVDEIMNKYIEGDPQISENPVHRDEIRTDNIAGLNTEDSSITEGTITYDIRFGAIVPSSGEPIRLIINIESQSNFYPGYPLIKRGIYYCSRMISSQYETYFTESHYEKLRKVYSIWICTNPPKNRENTIMQYSITEKSIVGNAPEKQENYDLITAIMICLGYDTEEESGILKLLEVLLSSKKTPEEKKKILSNEFNISMTKTFESEVSVMCNISQGIIEKCMNEGMEKGMAQGMAQGMEKGMAQGIEKNLLDNIKKLMNNLNFTEQQAMNILEIPEDEQTKLSAMLKK